MNKKLIPIIREPMDPNIPRTILIKPQVVVIDAFPNC